MFWIRRWKLVKKKLASAYERLSGGGASDDYCTPDSVVRVPRGHVPVLVGRADDVVGAAEAALERFVVPVRLFRDPSMVTLLDMGAQEFGYLHGQGILRIPCHADHSRRILGVIAKTN